MLTTSLLRLIDAQLLQLLQAVGFSAAAIADYNLNRWLAALLVALAAWATDAACRRILTPFVRRLTRATHTRWDDYLLNPDVLKGLSHLLPSVVVYVGLPLVLPAGETTLPGMFAYRAGRIYIAAAVIYLAFKFLDGLRTALDASHRFSRHYTSGFIQLGKLLVAGVGLIVIIGFAIDRSPLSLLAGLGVAATVLMLVFKDTLTGLVAGVQLAANNMLRRGDWITVEQAGVNGYVQDVTLTTVKVRNFDNTIVTLPPQTLMGESFKNWRGMRLSSGRRVNRALNVDLRSVGFASEAVKQQALAEGLLSPEEAEADVVNLSLLRRWAERYLRALPYVAPAAPDALLMVRQLPATPQGLPVEFYFFVTEKDWMPYERCLSEAMEHIIATLPRFGLRLFQYPQDRFAPDAE